MAERPTAREQIARMIAEVIEYPSVYMGGPNWATLRTAERIMAALEKEGVLHIPTASHTPHPEPRP